MSFTVIEDGDSLQIRATISDAKELAELIAKLEIATEWVEGARGGCAAARFLWLSGHYA